MTGKYKLLYFWTLLFTMVSRPASFAASIKGTVTMPDGKPAASFNVDLIRVSNGGDDVIRLSADSQGGYEAKNLQDGEYVLFFYNNSLGYPLRRDMFLDDKPLRLVVSGKEERVANVTLPDPAVMVEGIVHMGIVGPHQVTVSLCHRGQEWRSGTVQTDPTGHFRYIVPAHDELSVTVLTRTSGSFTFTPLRFASNDKALLDLDTSKAIRNAIPCKPFGS